MKESQVRPADGTHRYPPFSNPPASVCVCVCEKGSDVLWFVVSSVNVSSDARNVLAETFFTLSLSPSSLSGPTRLRKNRRVKYKKEYGQKPERAVVGVIVLKYTDYNCCLHMGVGGGNLIH